MIELSEAQAVGVPSYENDADFVGGRSRAYLEFHSSSALAGKRPRCTGGCRVRNGSGLAWFKLTLCAVTAFLVLHAAAPASARPLTEADEAAMQTAMQHIGAMADLLEKLMGRPEVMLKQLEAYVELHRQAMAEAFSAVDAAEEELTGDDLTRYREKLTSAPEIERFLTAVQAFSVEYEDRAEYVEKLDSILEGIGAAE